MTALTVPPGVAAACPLIQSTFVASSVTETAFFIHKYYII